MHGKVCGDTAPRPASGSCGPLGVLGLALKIRPRAQRSNPLGLVTVEGPFRAEDQPGSRAVGTGDGGGYIGGFRASSRATMFVSRHASSAEGARSESVGSGRLPGVSSTNRAGGAAGGPRSTSRGPVALRGRQNLVASSARTMSKCGLATMGPQGPTVACIPHWTTGSFLWLLRPCGSISHSLTVARFPVF